MSSDEPITLQQAVAESLQAVEESVTTIDPGLITIDLPELPDPEVDEEEEMEDVPVCATCGEEEPRVTVNLRTYQTASVYYYAHGEDIEVDFFDDYDTQDEEVDEMRTDCCDSYGSYIQDLVDVRELPVDR